MNIRPKQRALALAAVRRPEGGPLEPPLGFDYREWAILLLHIASELEHCLMAQYLYAAWTVGGPQVPEADRPRVQAWQEVILGIAKEEMGHLISVQNVLRLLGAPLCLERQDLPWDSEFYPFPFELERLTKGSLAKYIVAEASPSWPGPDATPAEKAEAAAIRAEAASAASGAPLHSVGELYQVVLQLVKEPDYLPDAAFRPNTLPFQATWDQWGRGYQGGQRGASQAAHTDAAPRGTPDVLVETGASRDDAVAALEAIMRQGESTATTDDELSHFTRFLTIYRELRDIPWSPSLPVVTNPWAPQSLDGTPTDTPVTPPPNTTSLENPEAVHWAELFNLRYRMLLVDLAHSYTLDAPRGQGNETAARGLLINATFGEMYNLRALAHILVRTPAGLDGAALAGPPFEMPYTLDLPTDPASRWLVHDSLYAASQTIVARLLDRHAESGHAPYLRALADADARARVSIQAILDPRRR